VAQQLQFVEWDEKALQIRKRRKGTFWNHLKRSVIENKLLNIVAPKT
jgi:hypothetical protein